MMWTGLFFGSQSGAISLSKIGFLSRFPLEADFLISLSSSFMCSGNIEVPLWRHLARLHFLPGKSEFLFSPLLPDAHTIFGLLGLVSIFAQYLPYCMKWLEITVVKKQYIQINDSKLKLSKL